MSMFKFYRHSSDRVLKPNNTYDALADHSLPETAEQFNSEQLLISAPNSQRSAASENKRRGELAATELTYNDDPRLLRAIAQPRIIIRDTAPCVDGGRYPAKAIVNQPVSVTSTIFADGHQHLATRILYKQKANDYWLTKPMTLVGNDRWQAEFTPKITGYYGLKIEAWLDQWKNYHYELYQKYHAGVSVKLEIEEGRLLLQRILNHALNALEKGVIGAGTIKKGEAEKGALEKSEHSACANKVIAVGAMSRAAAIAYVQAALSQLEKASAMGIEQQVAVLLTARLSTAVAMIEPRLFLSSSPKTLVIDVERTQAGYSSWYELFPRSITRSATAHGTFDDVISTLPAIRAMGFDVLYFPPIHPIGERNRKGKNNSLIAQSGDPGSPYAIGSAEGGHDQVYSKLGGIEAFRRLLQAAKEYSLEIALDFAIQCAPDHPWLTEHPEWFSWRPDGSIRYAENPPKKYQDIVNVDFYAKNAIPDMWLAWRDVILYWVTEGISLFRVDNPHTKPLPFWEWLIGDIRSRHPHVIFLAEAFTRPAMMHQLAKIGFSQSYTYFIWRETKQQLTDYMTELAQTDVRDFYRPHFFVNTPDINPYFLQNSGRPGFLIRAALAATLSGLWGMYAGFEFCESAALPGKEEYLDSEKYEIKPRNTPAPVNIIKEITRLNHIRKSNPALQTHLGLRFYECSNPNVIFFGKVSAEHNNYILVAISLNPYQGEHTQLQIPLDDFHLDDQSVIQITELMRDLELRWQGRSQHWYFDPNEIPFAIWRIKVSEV